MCPRGSQKLPSDPQQSLDIPDLTCMLWMHKLQSLSKNHSTNNLSLCHSMLAMQQRLCSLPDTAYHSVWCSLISNGYTAKQILIVIINTVVSIEIRSLFAVTGILGWNFVNKFKFSITIKSWRCLFDWLIVNDDIWYWCMHNLGQTSVVWSYLAL